MKKTLSSLLIIILLSACSSGKTEDDSQDIEIDPFAYNSIENPGTIHTLDNFISLGWKKSKSFPVDALNKEGVLITPDAIEIWYGFFNRKDIEIRFYPNHALTLTSGVMSAENAVGRAVNSNAKGGIITSKNNRVSYNSYVVSGNTVILCQDVLSYCKDLTSKLK